MRRWVLVVAGLYGALAVAMGAFAAHGLKQVLNPYSLDIVKTASNYLLIHAVALIGVHTLWRGVERSLQLTLASLGFIMGPLLFSGSLYLLAFGAPKWLGLITPFGGLLMIIGWLSLTFGACTRSQLR